MSIETFDTLPDQEPRERTGLPDLIVPPAMLAVAGACGVAGYLHLGLAPELAGALGLTLFCLLLVSHVLLRAADSADDAAQNRLGHVSSPLPPQPARPVPDPLREDAGTTPQSARLERSARLRRRQEAAEPAPDAAAMPVVPPPPPLPRERLSDQAARDAAARELAAEAELAAALEAKATSPSPPAPAPAPAAEPKPQAAAVAVPPPAPAPLPAAAVVPAAGPPPPPSTAPATPARLPEQASDLGAATGWTYRPVDLKLPVLEASRTPNAAAKAAIGELRPTLPAHPAGISSAGHEADRIESILKRLAVQIRAGQKAAEPDAASPAGATEPAQTVAVPAAPEPSDTALASAVDALRSTMEAMRTGARLGSAAPAARAAGGSAGAGAAADSAVQRLAAVAEALSAERADVYLEPILGLPNEQARHFEVSVRLKTPDGTPLDVRTLAAGAGGAGGAGLLPLLDALGVRHSAGFALKLERRGRDGSVFSRVAGASLESGQFVDDVAGRHAQGIADRLVLSFAQPEMQGLGPAQIEALSRLNALGFRFALQGVSDMDMDFEALKAVGFEFVKLDAEVFLNGLSLHGAHIPASDLCKHFAALGLSVIVGRIDDESVRARVIDSGAIYGQGALFGPPRPVPVGLGEGLAGAA